MLLIESNIKEEKDKKKGLFISLFTHVLIVLLLFLPFLKIDQIEESGGISVSFGDPNAGIDEQATTETLNSELTQINTPPSSDKDILSANERAEEAPVKASEKSKKNSDSNIVNNNDSEKRKREANEKAKADSEAAEKAKLASKKKQYSDLLSGGKGNNKNNENEGKENGDPDGKLVDGISKGSGKVGGGLSGRGVEFEPTFSDNSQKTGKVSLSICVDNSGKVTKAEFTQKGSTTSDAYLIQVARNTAVKYRFSKSNIELQCGFVTIDFKVQ